MEILAEKIKSIKKDTNRNLRIKKLNIQNKKIIEYSYGRLDITEIKLH